VNILWNHLCSPHWWNMVEVIPIKSRD
jgi:hypothetical protein